MEVVRKSNSTLGLDFINRGCVSKFGLSNLTGVLGNSALVKKDLLISGESQIKVIALHFRTKFVGFFKQICCMFRQKYTMHYRAKCDFYTIQFDMYTRPCVQHCAKLAKLAFSEKKYKRPCCTLGLSTQGLVHIFRKNSKFSDKI